MTKTKTNRATHLTCLGALTLILAALGAACVNDQQTLGVGPQLTTKSCDRCELARYPADVVCPQGQKVPCLEATDGTCRWSDTCAGGGPVATGGTGGSTTTGGSAGAGSTGTGTATADAAVTGGAAGRTDGPGAPVSTADAGPAVTSDGPAAALCPRTMKDAEGKGCDREGQSCTFPEGTCTCSSCGATEPVCQADRAPTWSCNRPGPGCPPAPPAIGSACPTAGTQCSYGCGPDALRTCAAGKWTGAYSPCPISRRDAKRDVTYLDDAEARRIARSLLSVKLATYQYRDPALAGRQRLGFIIDDDRTLPAIDPAHDMVDLYSYTSMLVAAMQAQARELEELRRQVRALQRRR